MCGFVGIISNELSIDKRESLIRRMLPFIERRGPDEQRLVHYQDGSFGFARLSIRALEDGSQPIVHRKRGTLSMTNGEIYNDAYLRCRYKNIEWETQSDCEAIHAISDAGNLEYDMNIVSGMFASAIYDSRSKSVRLVRDRTGQKPLFYALLGNHTIIYSSSIHAITASGIVPVELSQHELSFILFNEYPAPGTTGIEGIRAVRPGEVVKWLIGDYEVKKTAFWSWNLARSEYESKPTYKPLKSKIYQSLVDAIGQELVSDVPVGLFLSGGIDSSLILAIAKDIYQDNLQTFSVGFAQNDLDESNQAANLANHFGTDHSTIYFEDFDIEKLVGRAFSCLDVPLGDSSYIPSFLLCEVASQQVKCALGGDGGDELFGGYPTYQAHRLLQLYENSLPQLFRGFLLERISRKLPNRTSNINTKMKVDRFLAGRSMPLVKRHMTWMSTTYDPRQLLDLIQSDSHREDDLFGDTESLLINSGIKDVINAAQYIDLMTYLPGSIHAKMDCASMMNGIELRSPFVNSVMLEASASVTSNYRVGLGQSKKILRDIAKDKLPSEICKRPKRGFNFPVNHLLHTLLKDMAVSSIHSLDSVLDMNCAKQLLNNFFNGQGDHRKIIWTLFSVSQWYQSILQTKRQNIQASDIQAETVSP